MPDPIAQPSPSPNPTHPAWLLTPRDLSAIAAADRLLDRLARGEQPSEHDPDPAACLLARWLREVTNSTTTNAAVTRGIGGDVVSAVPNPAQPHWGRPESAAAGRLAPGWTERLAGWLRGGTMIRAVEIIVPEVAPALPVPALRRVDELWVWTR